MKITPLDEWIRRKTGSRDTRPIREHIERYQVQKLRDTIRLARIQSPFYRERLEGFTEEMISRTEDLARFPFTTTEDLRAAPLMFLCISQSEINRVVTLNTSGTTGDPKRIFFTDEEQQQTIDFFHNGMSTLVAPGDRVLILLPGERPGSVGDLLKTSLEDFGVGGVPHGPVRDVRDTLKIIAEESITALVGIPTQVLALARHSDGGCRPGAVLLSTDHVPSAIAREIHRVWGSEVYGHYGMTEMGFGGGVECEARRGYHMREADLLFEIVHPDTGAPLPEGEPGEVVFTTLTRCGMPLIRYRTGDLSRFIPGSCPCGTALRTMERVRERFSGKVQLANGCAVSIADLDEALFPVPALLDFSVTLTRERGVDLMHIEIKLINDKSDAVAPLVVRALNTVPPLREAQEKGRLVVRITAAESLEMGYTRGAAKRTILDKRKSDDML